MTWSENAFLTSFLAPAVLYVTLGVALLLDLVVGVVPSFTGVIEILGMGTLIGIAITYFIRRHDRKLASSILVTCMLVSAAAPVLAQLAHIVFF